MFLTKDFQLIDNELYKIIRMNEYDIELISMLTNHYWLLRSHGNNVMLFHKHPDSKTYHRQKTNYITLKGNLKYIRMHDDYVCSGE